MLHKLIPLSVKEKVRKSLFKMMRPEFESELKVMMKRDLLVDRSFQELLKSKFDSLDIEPQLFGKATVCRDLGDLIQRGIAQVKQNGVQGLYLEFGVYNGGSINFIARQTDQKVYGFDSFDGLPEDWAYGRYRTVRAGKRKLDHLPAVEKNVELVKGLFKDTLPAFVAEHPEPAAFVHVDCDLYSSAKDIFKYIRFQRGSVIVFGEYYNYPLWKEGEYKAFQEFLQEHNATATPIGYVPTNCFASFVIDAIG